MDFKQLDNDLRILKQIRMELAMIKGGHFDHNRAHNIGGIIDDIEKRYDSNFDIFSIRFLGNPFYWFKEVDGRTLHQFRRQIQLCKDIIDYLIKNLECMNPNPMTD